MKKDLDKLMRKMGIDTIYAAGKATADTTMYYLFNGANIYAHYVKKRGRPAVVIHYPIEREVAQKSGLRLININKYEIKQIFEKYPDAVKAEAFLIKTIFDDLKIRGTVAFYGMRTFATSYHVLRQFLKFDKRIRIHYDTGKSILSMARQTKGRDEVRRIRQVRNGVIAAFTHMLRTVQDMKVKNNVIMKDKKRMLRIGDLKGMLRRELFERNFVNSDGMIVAQGRDAGVPHNTGRDLETVRLGKTIVFDIFPKESGGGYCFDFTRTICFGYAPPKIQEVYKTVKDAQDYAINMLKVGKQNLDIEKSVCKFFEQRGHPTLFCNPKTQIGYCHSLGHGLGLNVHESPSFNLLKTNKDKITPGHVFTIEPGLYYPEKGFGVRLEDVIYVDTRGAIVNLTRCPRKLVVEM